jgi:hypothetical protein
MVSETMVCLVQNRAAIMNRTLSPNIPKQDRHDPRHLGVLQGASKIVSEPMVRLAWNVHLFCMNTYTISNWTERDSTWPASPRSSIGCIQNDFWACGMFGEKPCTYLLPTLTLCPNGPKWDSTWPTSPRNSIRCVQNCFRACGTFGANRAAISHRY